MKNVYLTPSTDMFVLPVGYLMNDIQESSGGDAGSEDGTKTPARRVSNLYV